MNRAAHAAVVLGDDLHYSFAWQLAVGALDDPDIASISVEDPEGGAYDDITVRRHSRASEHYQVKNSNTSKTVLDQTWLTTAEKDNGKSPLRRFADTWRALTSSGDKGPLILVTTRSIDGNDPMLGTRNISTGLIDAAKIAAAGSRSKLGMARDAWAANAELTRDELVEFLGRFVIRVEGSEAQIRELAAAKMKAAGLRHDADAVVLGVDLVREWVKQGVREVTRNELHARVAAVNLLAHTGMLVLAVHTIDRLPSPLTPTRTLDWVERYDGDDPRQRRLLRAEHAYAGLLAELRETEAELRPYGVWHLRVDGAARLSVHFTTGTVFSGVRGWQVSFNERGTVWSSSDDTLDVAAARFLGPIDTVATSGDLAVAVSLATDAGAAVLDYVRSSGCAAAVANIGSERPPGDSAISGSAHAKTWARQARELVRAEVSRAGAARIHLFLSAPAGAALLLGQDWNMLPPTTVYEYTGTTYVPTFEV